MSERAALSGLEPSERREGSVAIQLRPELAHQYLVPLLEPGVRREGAIGVARDADTQVRRYPAATEEDVAAECLDQTPPGFGESPPGYCERPDDGVDLGLLYWRGGTPRGARETGEGAAKRLEGEHPERDAHAREEEPRDHQRSPFARGELQEATQPTHG